MRIGAHHTHRDESPQGRDQLVGIAELLCQDPGAPMYGFDCGNRPAARRYQRGPELKLQAQFLMVGAEFAAH